MRASQCGGISQIITEMNRHLAHDVNDSGRFMTLSYVRFNVVAKIRPHRAVPIDWQI